MALPPTCETALTTLAMFSVTTTTSGVIDTNTSGMKCSGSWGALEDS